MSQTAARAVARSESDAQADRRRPVTRRGSTSSGSAARAPSSERPEHRLRDVAVDAPGPNAERPASAQAPGLVPNPTFQPPAIPETKLSPEEAAKRQAELQAAQAAFEEAGSAGDVVGAYADAPPTVKAGLQAKVGERVGAVVADDQTRFQAGLPALEVRMGGEVDEGAVPRVEAPKAGPVVLEGGTPPAAPRPDLGPLAAGRFLGNAGVATAIARRLDAPAITPEAIGDSFEDVAVSDPTVATSPGEKPRVPLATGTDTDPARIDAQRLEGERQSAQGRADASRAVVEGPGPEQVKLLELREERQVGELTAPQPAAISQAEGAAHLGTLALPEEVSAQLDDDLHAGMRDSVAEARRETEKAETDRDEQRKKALDDAEAERQKKVDEADTAQRAEVLDAQQAIQRERQSTLEAQEKAVADLHTGAEALGRDNRQKIDDRVTADERQISEKYDATERDAQAEVAKGETKAATKRDEEQKKASKQSWWERAKSFVKEAFSLLVAGIAAIFDAVRSVVNGLLEAARKFAKDLIDAAAAFVKGAIEAFGEALKGLVNVLLANTFPGLAKALNDKIDAGVATAKKAVDKVADKLKKGVDAIVDTLKKGLNAVIGFFQGAINFGLSLLQAAITGDWGAVLRQVLEAALKLLGIDPKEFYAFVGKILDTLGLIVDQPGKFLSNLLDAVKLGFGFFADNFLKHLQAGVIGWLTGALGGSIQLPKKWDLWGVLDLARQILGLTWDWLKERAKKLIGEKNVERLERLFSYVDTLRTEGWSGLFERIQGELSGLADAVLGQIKEFLVEKVVKAAILWLASLFNPVAALVKVVVTAWNLYTFLRDQLARIIEIVKTVVGALDKIARGVLDEAGKKVESVLGNLVPVAIDLLAKLLGLTGVAERVKEILGAVRKKIADAADRLLAKVASKLKGGRQAAAKSAAATPGAIQIGKRLTFKKGRVSHLLFFAVKDRDARVLMRSEERTVKSWIDELSTSFAERTEGWEAAKTKEARTALDTAARLLKETDREADSLVQLKMEVADPKTPRPSATAAKMTEQEVDKDQEALRGALEIVLKAFGDGPATDLATKYAADIRKMHQGWADKFAEELGKDPIAKRWVYFSWQEIKVQAAIEIDVIKRPFARELGPGKRFQREKGKDVVKRFNSYAKADWDHRRLRADKGATPLGEYSPPTDDEVGAYVGYNVYMQLVKAPSKPLDDVRSLIFAGGTYDDMINAIDENLKAAAAVWVAEKVGGREVDKRVKAISGTTVLAFLEAMAKPEPWGKIQPGEFETLFRSGSPEKRWLSAKFRDVDARRHEWIANELTVQVINTATSSKLPEGEVAGAIWVTYQNNLRTPTKTLIFKPSFSKRMVNVSPTDPFKSARPAAELAAFPKQGKAVVLQGHPGAVYAPVDEAGYREAPAEQSEKHREWQNVFNRSIERDLAGKQGIAAIKDVVAKVGKHFEETIWNPAGGGDDAVPEPHFRHYFAGRSASSGEIDHETLKTDQLKAFNLELKNLTGPADAIVARIGAK